MKRLVRLRRYLARRLVKNEIAWVLAHANGLGGSIGLGGSVEKPRESAVRDAIALIFGV